MTRTLVARLDNVGDVLLTGPAVRAVAASGHQVVYLAGPRGVAAAELLPGVDDVVVFDAPWVAFDAPPVDSAEISALTSAIADAAIDDAVVITSFHQSPLPLALLLRLAGVRRIAATCVDYPGQLLDVRHPYDDLAHEVEQSLSLCEAAGYTLPPWDDAALRICPSATTSLTGTWDGRERYVIVHPGASVPARQLPIGPAADVVHALSHDWQVVVTGTASEYDLAQRAADGTDPDRVSVLTGTLDLAGMAALVAGADAVVCGNTGIAHLASAVSTPVVEAFAPVVPAHRWHPWKVPHALLGHLDVECAGCRSRVCPFESQPCLAPFNADNVMAAIEELVA